MATPLISLMIGLGRLIRGRQPIHSGFSDEVWVWFWQFGVIFFLTCIGETGLLDETRVWRVKGTSILFALVGLDDSSTKDLTLRAKHW